MNNGDKIQSTDDDALQTLTHTLLYEGYSLYPYRNSALKNKTPIPFGVVYPKEYCRYNEYAEGEMQTECILAADEKAVIEVIVKFLQINKQVAGMAGEWKAIEREVNPGKLILKNLLKNSVAFPFTFSTENFPHGPANPVHNLTGRLLIDADKIEGKENGFRLTVSVINLTEADSGGDSANDDISNYAFVSTHTIIKTNDGHFISQQDPGTDWSNAVSQCDNRKTWPVLIDDENTTMLSSPIILYDHPEINAKSMGDLFDSTEMEEALLLHVNVLTDEEKKQVANGDFKMQAMIEKVKNVTPEELIILHDKIKNSNPKFFHT